MQIASLVFSNLRNVMKLNVYSLIFASWYFICPQLTLAADYSDRNEIQFNDYVIYYNTFPSVVLEPRIASVVGIKRSNSRSVLTIAVKKKRLGASEQSIKANISGKVYTLMGHIREIILQEVNDGDAIYYIGDFTALDRETLTFKLSVRPEGAIYSKDFEFKRGMYSRE